MKKRKNDIEIELPITPMLDLAFQLLTFFILTYNPAPPENQFAMSLLPVAMKTQATGSGAESDTPTIASDVETIPVTLLAGAGGSLAAIVVGDSEIEGADLIAAFRAQLRADYIGEGFDQATITVDGNLLYSELINVIDVFLGEGISKISFDKLAGQ